MDRVHEDLRKWFKQKWVNIGKKDKSGKHPELVGGKDGKLIGSWIAYHLKTTLNWGLCAALGAILLGVMLIFYWLYNKIVGIDNIKLG